MLTLGVSKKIELYCWTPIGVEESDKWMVRKYSRLSIYGQWIISASAMSFNGERTLLFCF